MIIQNIPVLTSPAQPSRPVCPPTPGQPRCADQATGNTTDITYLYISIKSIYNIIYICRFSDK